MDNNIKGNEISKKRAFYETTKHEGNKRLFIIGLIVFIGLIFVYSYKFKLADTNCFPEQIWLLLDPVSAIFTFLITIVILYNQANEKWKNSLEKRLDIDYKVSTNSGEEDKIIAQVKNAYLAGESDIRQWAQQLGQQMFGRLDFDMNWDDEKPIIKKDNKSGEYYISNKIIMYLTSNPLDTDAGKENIDKFLNRNFKHSKISGNEKKLPIKWERIENSNNNTKKVQIDFYVTDSAVIINEDIICSKSYPYNYNKIENSENLSFFLHNNESNFYSVLFNKQVSINRITLKIKPEMFKNENDTIKCLKVKSINRFDKAYYSKEDILKNYELEMFEFSLKPKSNKDETTPSV